MSSVTQSGTNCCYSFARLFPLVTPALKVNSCEVDQSLLNKRILIIVSKALAFFVASLLFPVASLYLTLAALGTLCVIPLDHWRAERAADQKAVGEYKDSGKPSISATNHIRKSLGTAKWLISCGGDIDKVNEAGETLLESHNKCKGMAIEVKQLLHNYIEANKLHKPLLKPLSERILRQIPLIKPAVLDNCCEVDHALLSARIWKIATVVLGLLVAALFFPAAHVILSLTALGTLCVIPLDRWLSERAADKKAVEQYLNYEKPSLSATARIGKSVRAASLYLQGCNNIHKIDERGKTLLSHLGGCKGMTLEVFKCLLKDEGEIEVSDDNIRLFETLIKHQDPSFLEYALKGKKLDTLISYFGKNQKTWIWRNFTNKRTASLLQNAGCNVDEKDKDNLTALMHIAQNGLSADNYKVQTLIDLGADLSIKKRWSTAFDMCPRYCGEMKKLLKPKL